MHIVPHIATLFGDTVFITNPATTPVKLLITKVKFKTKEISIAEDFIRAKNDANSKPNTALRDFSKIKIITTPISTLMLLLAEIICTSMFIGDLFCTDFSKFLQKQDNKTFVLVLIIKHLQSFEMSTALCQINLTFILQFETFCNQISTERQQIIVKTSTVILIQFKSSIKQINTELVRWSQLMDEKEWKKERKMIRWWCNLIKGVTW